MRFLLLFILLLPQLSAGNDYCSDEYSQNYQPINEQQFKTLFFSINKCGITPSHIMGTMHSDSNALQHVLDKANQVTDTSSLVYLEVDMQPSTAIAASKRMYLPLDSTKTLPDIIGENVFDQLTQLVQQNLGLPSFAIKRMKPWAAAMLLQYPAPEGNGVVLDQKIYNYADAKGIKTDGLEDADELLDIFDTMSNELQLKIVEYSINEYPEISTMNDKLLNLYSDQDLLAINNFVEEQMQDLTSRDDELLKQLGQLMQQQVMIKRNYNMVSAAKAELQNGNIFIAVGAAHLLGDEGILKLLEDEGYFIQPH